MRNLVIIRLSNGESISFESKRTQSELQSSVKVGRFFKSDLNYYEIKSVTISYISPLGRSFNNYKFKQNLKS